jgi:molybdenum cofactor guanylyltransferase
VNILGVILSGGKSSRMGSEKGLVKYKGKALVEYSIGVLKPFCEEIVISTNSMDYSDFGYSTISDIVSGIGPMGGMFSVMHERKADNYFFIACDTPHLNIQMAKDLIKEISFADIVVPKHSGDKIEPLFGVYSSKVLAIIKKQIDSGNYKLMDLLKACNTYYYDLPDEQMKQNPDMFKNINKATDVD